MGGRIAVIPDLEPGSYARHALHGESCAWVEKNCYVDVWIELLHALKLNPLAMLAAAVTVDFEGDQWTFFKPSHADLWDLYGIEVQELTVWRPLLDHAIEHLGAGKFISTEADSFWLPDTAGTDYRQAHTKTTIVLNDLDAPARHLGYFHNAGYYRLDGEDFDRLFGLATPRDPAFMPLFAEFMRVDRVQRRDEETLARLSQALLQKSLQRLPARNPLQRFADHLRAELPELASRGLAHYHTWAFSNTRQLGLAFELAASYFRWLQPYSTRDYQDVAAHCARIAALAKSLIMKGARAASTGKAAGFEETLQGLSATWAQVASALR